MNLASVRIEPVERSASAAGLHAGVPSGRSALSPTGFGSVKMQMAVAAVFPTTPSPATIINLQDLRLQLSLTPEPMDTDLMDELGEIHGGDEGQPRSDDDDTDSVGKDILQSSADEDIPPEKEKEGVEEEGEGEGPPQNQKRKSQPQNRINNQRKRL